MRFRTSLIVRGVRVAAVSGACESFWHTVLVVITVCERCFVSLPDLSYARLLHLAAAFPAFPVCGRRFDTALNVRESCLCALPDLSDSAWSARGSRF